jgi:hypothetical protein
MAGMGVTITKQYQRNGAAAKAWIDRQSYDVAKAAQDPNTSLAIMLDIAQYATSQIIVLLCANKGAPTQVLELIMSCNPNEAMKIRLVNNPNTSGPMLVQMFNGRGHYKIQFGALAHPNIPISFAKQLLPDIQREYRYLVRRNAYNDVIGYHATYERTLALNPAIPFALILEHIQHYYDFEIEMIVKARRKQLRVLLAPFKGNQRGWDGAVTRYASQTFFGTTEIELLSDWYDQLMNTDGKKLTIALMCLNRNIIKHV